MKICSLYGAGFYYIPGTDTCLKIGGFVRAEMDFYANGSFTAYQNGNIDNPGTNWQNQRVRWGITADARSQTAYGTLRAFVYMAPTNTNHSGAYNKVYSPAGFIQWAGFTFGVTDSFFSFDGQGYTNGSLWAANNDPNGMPLFAYTAQFGNGLSASLSVEDTNGRRTAVLGNSQTYAGREWPDVVGNLRIDQAWGSAQIMGALHNVHTYDNAAGATGSNEQHKLGYALGAGVKFNLPMLGHGDYVQGSFTYTKGALAYLTQNDSAGDTGINNGSFLLGKDDNYGNTNALRANKLAYGDLFDAVGTNAGGGLDLTTAWGLTAGYEHHWNPMWKSSVYGDYMKVNYSGAASAALIAAKGLGTTGDADFDIWQIGSRTVWTPVHNLDFSVDLVYSQVDTAFKGQAVKGGGTYGDIGFLSGIFRVQRNF